MPRRRLLCSIFLALDAALSSAYSRRNYSAGAVINAYAAAYMMGGRSYAAAKAVVYAAEAAACAAHAVAVGADAADAVAFYAADVAIYAAAAAGADPSPDAANTAASSSAVAAIEHDLEHLLQHSWSFPLWPEGRCPEEIAALAQTFLAALRDLGLGYWTREYECWTRGEFDLTRRLRREELSEEIIAAGPDAIMAFLEADSLARLAEARVILLGDGEVGKTSLIRRLHGEALKAKEPPTPGVEIREWDETVAGKPLHVHYWDFGGQVFLHASHQFFLREKCVHVILLKARSAGERELVEYWLEHVRVFGHGAPTLIVQNQVDALDKGMATPLPFDCHEIQRRYPFVKGFFNLSCAKDWGLAELKAAIFAQLADKKILDEQTPEAWFHLKTHLRRELHDQRRSFIDSARYSELCDAAAIDEAGKKAALDALDQLGVALHFPEVDPDWYVLDPAWLTQTIYHLLWRSDHQDWRGNLSVAALEQIFNAKLDPKAPVVPPDKFPALLKLLVCFELAYESKGRPGNYRVPMLAPETAPALPQPTGESVVVTAKMETFLPPALFYRFVTQCGAEIVGEKLWRDGCFLSHGGAEALIRYERQARAIRIEVWGGMEPRGQYCTALRTRLFKLLGQDAYQNLEYTPRITVKDRDYGWREALGSLVDNQPTVYDTSGRPSPLLELVTAAFGLGQITMGAVAEERRLMNREMMDLLRHLAVGQPGIHIHNTQNQSNEQNQTLTLVQHLQSLARLSSGLDELGYDIDRLKLQGEEIAAAKQDLAELRRLIESYKANLQPGPVEDTERETLMDRIKRTGARVLQAVSSIDNLTTIAVNVKQLLNALNDHV